MTVVSDDTNVWINNPSQKRNIDASSGVVNGVTQVKGMKRVQSLLGMLQNLILRRKSEEDGCGTSAQIHAPCQLLPRANAWTILSRLRRWSLFSSVGCAPQFGGDDLWNKFAEIPLKLIVHC